MVSGVGKLLALASLLATVAAQSCPCPRNYYPLCGSDGTTYGNPCTFRCARSYDPTLYVRYQGKCRSKRTPDQESCPCTRELQTVCGSDGVTYKNPCLLKCAAKSNQELTESHEGSCTEQKKWPCACQRNYRPVCGSDGTTYGNECTFHCAQNTNPDLTLSYMGKCREASKGQGENSASCPCTRELQIICGTDGVTYRNPCLLKCAAKSNPDLKEARAGPCIVKENKVWPCICTMDYKPVCGSDGTTYGNECAFHCAQNSNRDLSLSHNGECEGAKVKRSADREGFCPCTRELKKVCGTDGVTYRNPCLLDCAAKTSLDLKKDHDGPCSEEKEQIKRWETKKELCPCTRELHLLCGSNGRTYSNPCLLKCAAKSSPGLRAVHSGPCLIKRTKFSSL